MDVYDLLRPKLDVEDILSEQEMEAIFEAYYAVTGDRDYDNIASVFKQAAAIRLYNTILDDVVKGEVGLSLSDGKLAYHQKDSGKRMDS